MAPVDGNYQNSYLEESTRNAFSNLLVAALRPSTIHEAEGHLRKIEDSDASHFMALCANELSDIRQSPPSRHLAGLLLKNAITGNRLGSKKKVLNERWLKLIDNDVKSLVKRAAINTLSNVSDRCVWSVAACVVAAIGVLEIPRGLWLDCVPWLQKAADGNMGSSLREPAFVAIAYLAEDWWYAFVPEVYGDTVEGPLDLMMGASVRGLDLSAPLPVRKAAAQAFFSILGNVQGHLANDERQSILVRAILSNCDFNVDQELAHLSYRCLGRLATESYSLLAPSIHDMVRVTIAGIAHGPELVATSSVDCWSSVAIHELALAEGSQRFLTNVISTLLPVLLSALLRTEAAGDPETGAPSMLCEALCSCLALLCQVVPEFAVDHIIAFVASNFESQHIRNRYAAIVAYGSLMDGPKAAVGQVVTKSFGGLLQAMDEITLRRVAACSAARALELQATNVPEEAWVLLLPVSIKMAHHPEWSEEFSYVLDALATGSASKPQSLPYVAKELVLAAFQANPNGCGVLLQSLCILVQKATEPDCMNIFRPLLLELLKLGARPRALQGEVMGLGNCLEAVTEKLGQQITVEMSESMMELYILALQNGLTSSQDLPEETLRAVGALVSVLGPRSGKYMPVLWPALAVAFEDTRFPRTRTTALTVVRVTIVALGSEIFPYAEQIQSIILQVLKDPGLAFELRPLAVSVAGSLCRELGGKTPSLASILDALRMISVMLSPSKNKKINLCGLDAVPRGRPMKKCTQRAPDSWMRRRELAVALLEAYEGVVSGLEKSGHLESLEHHLSALLDFVTCCAAPQNVHTMVLMKVLHILGPLAVRFPGGLATFCWSDESNCVSRVIDVGTSSVDIQLRLASARLMELRDS